MNMLKLSHKFLPILTVLFCSCASSGSSKSPSNPETAAKPVALAASVAPLDTVALSESDVNNLVVGQMCTISLKANPSTGFMWKWNNSQTSLVDSVSRVHVSTAAKGMIGGGGVDTWTFKAVAAGHGSIELHYVRPWGNSEPESVASYKLNVTEK